MSRRSARKGAFVLLFQMEFADSSEREQIKSVFFSENPEITEDEKSFIIKEVDGANFHIEEIDELIKSRAIGWDISRMSKIDLAILRLAVYEMKFSEDITISVAINEAVELAKKYSSDEAPAFINGILGKV
ncbi:MAG: transcription antitermination factor NusB [Lachnospiraceae bacterium]|nr:transcription antitermination factor NusB [Lachnospiraceae bacterium]